MEAKYSHVFNWIEDQHSVMLDQVIEWANINSYTFNRLGIKSLSAKVKEAFHVFGEDVCSVDLPAFSYINAEGEASELDIEPLLLIQKRPAAKRQALFVIHLDTIYPPQESLEEAYLIEGRYLTGQGVSQAKGGIAVLLKALEAFEKCEVAENIGWNVILHADEGISSSCSAKIIEKIAKRCDIGFVFEPCLPNGNLVSSRKGSGYYTLVAHGKIKHATRSLACASNPLDALASCVSLLHALNGIRSGLTVNIGLMHGGSAIDVVPHVGIMRFDVRVKNQEDRFFIEEEIQKIVQKIRLEKNISLDLYGGFLVPPKSVEGKTLNLYKHVQQCGQDLGLGFNWESSDRPCVSNLLAAVGLPTIDTLGVQGGGAHDIKEFMYINSLRERTKLTTLSLIQWANGHWDF